MAVVIFNSTESQYFTTTNILVSCKQLNNCMLYFYIILKTKPKTMIFLSWILIFCCNSETMFSTGTKFWPSVIVDSIVYQIKPHHVILFMDSNNVRGVTIANEENISLFIRSLTKKVSTATIDLTAIKKNYDNRSLEIPIFRNSRSSVIHVILQNEQSDFNGTYTILDNFVRSSPIPMRPKCLLIFFGNMKSTYNVENLLQYAWSLKFLDFSIIKIEEKNSIHFFNYNPFTENYVTEYVEAVINIFPDKLNNVHKYPFKLPGYHLPPFICVDKQSNKTEKFNGIYYMYFESFAEKYNFTLQFIMESGYDTLTIFKNIFEKMEYNKVNAMPTALLVGPFLYNKNFLVGKSISESKFGVIIPYIKKLKIHFSSDKLLYLLYFPIILLIYFTSQEEYY